MITFTIQHLHIAPDMHSSVYEVFLLHILLDTTFLGAKFEIFRGKLGSKHIVANLFGVPTNEHAYLARSDILIYNVMARRRNFMLFGT